MRAQHNKVVQVAIFDCNSYEVGSYAQFLPFGKNQKAQRSCAGLQSKIATSEADWARHVRHEEGWFE